MPKFFFNGDGGCDRYFARLDDNEVFRCELCLKPIKKFIIRNIYFSIVNRTNSVKFTCTDCRDFMVDSSLPKKDARKILTINDEPHCIVDVNQETFEVLFSNE